MEKKVRGNHTKLSLFRYHKRNNYSNLSKKGNRLPSNYCKSTRESSSSSFKRNHLHNNKLNNSQNSIINKRTISQVKDRSMKQLNTSSSVKFRLSSKLFLEHLIEKWRRRRLKDCLVLIKEPVKKTLNQQEQLFVLSNLEIAVTTTTTSYLTLLLT